jgi:hypothetical protein
MSPRWFLRLLALWVLSVGLAGCGTLRDLVLPPLPPQACKPAADLPPVKTITPFPEREVPNEEFYVLALQERKDHAKDVQDYNSLYKTCVGE